MKIEYLNHSSIVIKFNYGINILFDPWFSGKCFNDGWGLKFNYKIPEKIIKECHYLWISHFHSDHFHIPTLKNIININPNIIVLGNRSYNFQFDKILYDIGFKNIVPLEERKKIRLDLCRNIEIIRYPTTGIDNMLLISSPEGKILNYNDCNIPVYSQIRLKKKIGEIDLLLNNFNPAGKILQFPLLSEQEIKKDIKNKFYNTIDIFSPNYTIPFASYHYFRAPESFNQNNFLINADDLETDDYTIIPLNVRDTLIYDKESNKVEINKIYNIKPTNYSIKIRTNSININKIQEACKNYLRKINKRYCYFTFWIPSLRIRVDDYNMILEINTIRKHCNIIDKGSNYHINAHSSELYCWWSELYGTDTFYVGAHFEISSKNIFSLRALLLLGLLMENRLDLVCLLKMIFSYQGLLFFYNRREEIMGTLLSRNIIFGPRN